MFVALAALGLSIAHLMSAEWPRERTWKTRLLLLVPFELGVAIPTITYLHVKYGAVANSTVEWYELWLLALPVVLAIEILFHRYYAFFIGYSMAILLVPPLSAHIAQLVALLMATMFQRSIALFENYERIVGSIAKTIPFVLAVVALVFPTRCAALYTGSWTTWPTNTFMSCDAAMCPSVFTDPDGGPLTVLAIAVLSMVQYAIRGRRIDTRGMDRRNRHAKIAEETHTITDGSEEMTEIDLSPGPTPTPSPPPPAPDNEEVKDVAPVVVV